MMYSKSPGITETSNPRSGVYLSQATSLDGLCLVHWESTSKPSFHAVLLVQTASLEEKVDTELVCF